MTSDEQIRAEIMAQAAAQSELREGFKAFLTDVVQVWRSNSPVKTGRYAASVNVIKQFKVDGMPAATVGSLSNRVHLIEYGTGEDKKVKEQGKPREDGRRYVARLDALVGPDTPTPAFAPRALTAARFGGDETPVRDIMEDDLGRDDRKAALKPFGQTLAYMGDQ